MTPLSLHATAAAWSLHAARDRLTYLASTQPRHDEGPLAAASVLSSRTFGVRMSVGGHGDPVTALLVDDRARVRENTWAELVERLNGKLGWLAEQIGAKPGDDPWQRIHDTLDTLSGGTLRIVTQHLADEDAWVRGRCRLDPARHPLPGVPCPACRARNLHVQDAGPTDVWTVVCDGRWDDGQHNPCLCVGPACPCQVKARVPGAVEGVAHIWRLGAVAGATPSRRVTVRVVKRERRPPIVDLPEPDLDAP